MLTSCHRGPARFHIASSKIHHTARMMRVAVIEAVATSKVKKDLGRKQQKTAGRHDRKDLGNDDGLEIKVDADKDEEAETLGMRMQNHRA